MTHPTLLLRTLAALLIAMIASTAGATQPQTAPETKPATNQETIHEIQSTRQSMRRFGLADAPATTPGTFRLTTYNIENLFDTHDDPTLTGDFEDAGVSKPEHELIATALAIHAVNADVLCVEEIESQAALIEYRDTYLADMGYDHVVSIDAGNDRGIENGVLSRYPISHAENWPKKLLGGVHPEKYGKSKNWYAGQPIAFRRSPMMVDIEIPYPSQNDSQSTDDDADSEGHAWTLTLFVMHHKSGYYNAYWREAEAKGTIEIIRSLTESHPDRPIIVLGDFNAEPNADSVKAYLNDGFVDIFADRVQNSKVITHESDRRIDLILANPAALKRMELDSAFVYGTTARPSDVSYRDMPTFVGYASDHYPVSVDLVKKPD